MSTKAAFYSKISIIYLIFKNDITTKYYQCSSRIVFVDFRVYLYYIAKVGNKSRFGLCQDATMSLTITKHILLSL